MKNEQLRNEKDMNTCSLSAWLRYHLALKERMADFEIGTEEVRVLIDFWEEYNEKMKGDKK